jgi:hypothetical protein
VQANVKVLRPWEEEQRRRQRRRRRRSRRSRIYEKF